MPGTRGRMQSTTFAILAALVAVASLLGGRGVAASQQTNSSGANFTAAKANTASMFGAAQLSAPSNLTASASGSNVALTWTAGDVAITGYRVLGAPLSGTSCGTFAQLGTAATTSYTDSGRLTGSTTGYCYEVIGVVGNWTSTTSNVAQVSKAPAAGSCTATWAVTGPWSHTQFQATITVKNTGSSPTTSWQLNWTWPDSSLTVTNWSNATGSQSGTTASGVNLSTNGVIAAGSTVAVLVNVTGDYASVPALTIDCGPRHALPGSACTATYTITDQWATGFNGTLAVKNTGTTTMNSWTVTWTFAGNQTITLYDAIATQSGKNVTVVNETYNGQLTPGSSVSSGFGGTYSGTNAIPTLTCTAA